MTRCRGQTRTITNGGTFVTRWGYNSAGLLTSMQYPSNNDSGLGEQVMYSYLPQMALNSMFVGTPPGDPIYVQGTSYDAAGRATLRTVGSSGTNAVQTRFTYSPWDASVQGGKLQQMTSTRDGQVLQNLQYVYDRNSNIETIQDYVKGSPQTQSFQYDSLDRLTSARASGGTEGTYDPEDYNYDAATGNLSNKAGAAYSYEAQNANCPDGALDKAHAVVTAGANTYCYDQDGNMVRRTISNTTYILTYDAENHMTGYSGPNLNASFVYDGDGKRVQSTVNGVTTTFVGNHVEWKTNTNDMVRYYYAGGVRAAMRSGDTNLTWLVGDHLGSTSLAVNAADGNSTTKGYKAWGEDRFGSVPTNYQYTGQYKERPEIGLYYYGARWYDSSLSRFSQPDTIIPKRSNTQKWDRYAYVFNQPLKYIDTSGHEPIDEFDVPYEPCDDSACYYPWVLFVPPHQGGDGINDVTKILDAISYALADLNSLVGKSNAAGIAAAVIGTFFTLALTGAVVAGIISYSLTQDISTLQKMYVYINRTTHGIVFFYNGYGSPIIVCQLNEGGSMSLDKKHCQGYQVTAKTAAIVVKRFKEQGFGVGKLPDYLPDNFWEDRGVGIAGWRRPQFFAV